MKENIDDIFTPEEMRKTIEHQIKMLRWPTIKEQQEYWKTHDAGGNVIPDRIEANEDRYNDESMDGDDIDERNDHARRYNLRDEGRNPNGSGESYAERNA